MTTAFARLAAYDWLYGVFAGLVVLGFVFYGFALAVLVFQRYPESADVFAYFGTAAWALALAILFFFLSDPQLRHSPPR